MSLPGIWPMDAQEFCAKKPLKSSTLSRPDDLLRRLFECMVHLLSIQAVFSDLSLPVVLKHAGICFPIVQHSLHGHSLIQATPVVIYPTVFNPTVNREKE